MYIDYTRINQAIYDVRTSVVNLNVSDPIMLCQIAHLPYDVVNACLTLIRYYGIDDQNPTMLR